MKRSTLIALAALATAAAAVGCNGASPARENEASGSTAVVSPAAATTVSTPDVAASAATTSKPLTPRDTVAIPSPAGATRGGPLPPPDASGIIETSFDDVRFPMKKTDLFAESMLTDRVKSLVGQRIRIRGYMYPTNRKRGLKQFVLVRDNMECCFGPGAALFDCIIVNMEGGATAEYSIRPIAVEGEFRLDVLPGPEGRPMAIYQLKGEAVK